jgi:hypothetical protein
MVLTKELKRIAIAKLQTSGLSIKTAIAQLKATPDDKTLEEVADDLDATAARLAQVAESLTASDKPIKLKPVK